MNTPTIPSSSHVLRFLPLRDAARGYRFPCDERGGVDLDAMSEHARNNYFFARALVGRAYRAPTVEMESPCAGH